MEVRHNLVSILISFLIHVLTYMNNLVNLFTGLNLNDVVGEEQYYSRIFHETLDEATQDNAIRI
jgi:hypothetical protein